MKGNNRILFILGIIIVIAIIFLPSTGLFGAYHPDTKSECEDRKDQKESDGYDCVIGCFKMTSSVHNCISDYGYDGFSNNIGEWYVYYRENDNCDDYYGDKIEQDRAPEYIGLYQCVPMFEDAVGDVDIPEPWADVIITNVATTETTNPLEVRLELSWTAEKPPYVIEWETGDGEGEYIENINTKSYVLFHTYNSAGTYDGSICVYDQDSSTENDCNSLIITVSSGDCNTNADTNCNGIITFNELNVYAQSWVNNQVSFNDLITAANQWVSN